MANISDFQQIGAFVQSLNNLSIPNGSNAYSNFIPTSAFRTLGVTQLSDTSAVGIVVTVIWSFDGVTRHGSEIGLTSAASYAWGTGRSFGTTIKAPFAQIVVSNGDTVPRTQSLWINLS